MKWMIASDIHGSAYYCGQLLNAYNREQADRLLLLGDLLYHGPRNDLPEEYDPKQVIELLNAKKQHILCVRGNCDAEVDQMRSVVGDNHVGWGDVPMDDAMPVQLGHGIAQLADQLCRRALRKFFLLLNDVLQRPPRYVVIHHHEMIGQLVCCLDVWQAWVRAGAESAHTLRWASWDGIFLRTNGPMPSMLTSSVTPP